MLKLVVKKTYCPSCKKLVKGREQRNTNQKVVVCPLCSRTLWTRCGSVWRWGA